MNYFLINENTKKVYGPYPSAEDIANAKLLGARNAKFGKYSTFSGHALYGTKTHWQLVPENYYDTVINQ